MIYQGKYRIKGTSKGPEALQMDFYHKSVSAIANHLPMFVQSQYVKGARGG